jgi:hypothetical protein
VSVTAYQPDAGRFSPRAPGLSDGVDAVGRGLRVLVADGWDSGALKRANEAGLRTTENSPSNQRGTVLDGRRRRRRRNAAFLAAALCAAARSKRAGRTPVEDGDDLGPQLVRVDHEVHGADVDGAVDAVDSVEFCGDLAQLLGAHGCPDVAKLSGERRAMGLVG